MPKLSITMTRALDACRAAGGLWRWPGGWWVATPPADVKKIVTPGQGVESWSKQTVFALVDRGLADVTERAGQGEFAVKITAK